MQCPLRVLWGERGIIGRLYDPISPWRAYCDGPVSGGAIASGHYIAEEAPDALLAKISHFLACRVICRRKAVHDLQEYYSYTPIGWELSS